MKKESEVITNEKVSSKQNYSNSFRRIFVIISVEVLIVIGLSLLNPYFLTTRNILNVLRQSSFLFLVAIGQTLVIITAGIDLSVGTIVSITGCAAAYFAIILNGNLAVAYTLGILLGGMVGFLSSMFIVVGNVVPFLATLSTSIIGYGVLLYVTKGVPIPPFLEFFSTLGRGYVGWIPIPIIIIIIIGIIFYIITSNTVFGKHIYAVGGNPNAARVSGINVKKIICCVYTISGLLSGLAGVMLASRLDSGQPTAGVGMELTAIAASVVGGASFFGGEGSIYGTALGVLLIGIIGNGLNLLNISSFLHQAIIGIVIIIAVVVDQSAKRDSL